MMIQTVFMMFVGLTYFCRLYCGTFSKSVKPVEWRLGICSTSLQFNSLYFLIELVSFSELKIVIYSAAAIEVNISSMA